MYGGRDRRGTRKPLVIFTPKSLLRHPRAVSTLHDFSTGGFIEILPDATVADPQTVSRVVFCSGKIYYDLLLAREERKADHVALVRVEQLYPFEADQASEILSAYSKDVEVVWAQEEPRNMGAWHFIQDKMQAVLDSTGRDMRYIGRPESASPATGSGKRHQAEQAAIIQDALTRGAVSAPKLVRKKKS
jgi:2-oxoglutarate dehydrogenase E1 component